MPLSASQIIALSCQDAKCPGFTDQAGNLLNMILSDLCQTYEFDAARGTYVFNFNTSQPTNAALYPNVLPGSGPYQLPADFLRMIDDKDACWFLQGVPYPMIPCDLSEFDNLVQQAGLQSYPYILATDMSTAPPNGPGANLLIWPPASGAYLAQIRYRRQMPDIVNPATSGAVPWFQSQAYLRTRLTGELMKITDDERMKQFLGTGEEGAQGILTRYLKLVNDQTDRAQQVKLDRRSFRSPFNALKNTKVIGW